MRPLPILTLLMIFLFSSIQYEAVAQGTKLGTPKVGNQFPQKNFGADNHFLLREAERQLNLLDYEQAEITLEYALAQNPQSVDALVQRAKFNRTLGRRARAEADIAQANRLNPYAADLYGYNGPYGILNILALLPDEQPVYSFELVDQILPYYYDQISTAGAAKLMESEKLMDVLYNIEAEQWEEAIWRVEQHLLEFPTSKIALGLEGMISIVLQDFSRAESALQKVVSLTPASALAWFHYSRLEQLRSNYTSALEYIDRAIKLQPNMDLAHLQRGAIYRTMGRLPEAIADYQTVAETAGPLQRDALINRGITRKFAGDFQGAFADLTRVLDNSFDAAEVYKHRGNLYLLFGFTNLAITDYTEAIAREPDFVEAYYNRGLAHFLRHDPLAACQDLEQSANLGFAKAAEMQRFFCIE